MTEYVDYFNQAKAAQEQTRLVLQSQMLDKSLGSMLAVLPEKEQERIRDIVDIGCGPGTTLIGEAIAHPEKRFTGIDREESMITYALARMHASDLHNIQFLTGDLRQAWPFVDASFDMIFGRLIFGFIHKSHYTTFLQEAYRVLRPGGYLLWWETDFHLYTNSQALAKLYALGKLAFFRRGVGLSVDCLNISSSLVRWYKQIGFHDVKWQIKTVDCSAGTQFREQFYQDQYHFFSMFKDYCKEQKVINDAPHPDYEVTQEEYDSLVEKLESEMLSNDHVAFFNFIVTYGRKPEKGV
ncbi:ubiquinone/menaquinone biosynthesis C-methylase UbiE [Thermosporothrix hazakensis]|jgi:ubiquinone/menaquinone biosynthesis C-methylase UbiE|uniref:Ubiquinone/menaquinone biosynthesis C-methylase UbiE n=1 Tax=Thermosporothrix hazakensis TaxID=644383 RepID=A0A326U300_THEHA|nr:class I SAM-dependent methyltransferase [Thermosporothrix hazakensis]PZW25346.1 ubiquinone/menaquinone biosynthesis C-methylase UbiE [Thermosporothrix hazakensis]GCE50576.1 hypothetical protein KTH_54450 [Thermosporothrix hazakensis]